MERIGYSEKLLAGRMSLRERNDCTVMAWANCFDCDYEKAHKHLAKFGRRVGDGMYDDDIKSALLACKKVKIKFGPYGRQNRITLNQFIKKHPKGRYYILVRDHALCVKDGVIYDHSLAKRRLVSFAARVYLEGEI